MAPLEIVEGAAAVLPLADVDTDVIIRIERLTQGDQAKLGDFAFEALRYLEDGQENPDFPLNRPGWRNAPILLLGPNFGCGSSREGAVTALSQKGVKCLIANSFGEIFEANCFQNGLLPIRMPEAQALLLMAIAQRSDRPFRIDLRRQVVTDGEGGEHRFAIAPLRREGLLAGLDDLGLTLRDADAIAAWQKEDRRRRPWAWRSVRRGQETDRSNGETA